MPYTDKRKEAVLKKMMPPNNKSIQRLAKEEGISPATLFNWRKQARAEGLLMPDRDSGPAGWTSRDKFAAVLESASLNEADLAQYCRQKGIYPEQLAQWKQACESANDWDGQQASRLRKEKAADQKRMRQLEKELLRKDKALAEAAALLVLEKKVQALWGTSEDE